MEFLKDRRTLLALVGGALALLAGLIIANVMVNKGKDEKPSAPPPPRAGWSWRPARRTTAVWTQQNPYAASSLASMPGR